MNRNMMEYAGVFLVVLILLTAVSRKCYAQDQAKEVTLKGMVQDSSARVMEAAVSLLRVKDSTVLQQTQNGRTGFQMKIAPGRYILKASLVGYRTVFRELILDKKDELVDVGAIRLNRAPLELREVQVRASVPPVVMKGDTVVYNAGSFKTRANSTLEELLKKLPGLEVDKDGVITYQGKRITYIYINGKEFFLDDPKLISENLRADMISKIELFEAKSRQSRLTGIPDTDPQKALNIKLKKGVSLAFTGKAYGGMSNYGGYTGGIRASSFTGERAILGELNSNNINDLYKGQDKTEPGRFTSGTGSTTGGNLIYSDRWSKSVRASLNYNGSHKENMRESQSRRQTFLGDSTLEEVRGSKPLSTWDYHAFGGEIEIKADSAAQNTISYRPQLSNNRNNSRSNDQVSQYIINGTNRYHSSEGMTQNTSADNIFSTGNALNYTGSFKPRALILNISQDFSKMTTNGELNSSIAFFNPDGRLNRTASQKQQFRQKGSNSGYSIDLSDMERLSDSKTLAVTYNYKTSNEATKRLSYDYNPVTGLYDLADTATTNDLHTGSSSQGLNLNYSSAGKQLRYQLGTGGQYQQQQSQDNTKGTAAKTSFTNWNAMGSVDYKLETGPEGTKELALNYNVNARPPDLREWQPLPDHSDPYNIRTGNPDLKAEQDHNIRLQYRLLKVRTAASLALSLEGSYKNNIITGSVQTEANGIQESSYVNNGSLYGIRTTLNYNHPLGEVKHGSIWLYAQAGYQQQDRSVINGMNNLRAGYGGAGAVRINYRPIPKLELNAESTLQIDRLKYTLNTALNTAQLTQHYRFAINWELPEDILFSTDYSYTRAGAQANLPVNQTQLLNAALQKNVLKNKRGELRLSCFDVLNSNKGIIQTLTATGIYRSVDNTPGRQLLLTAAYYFR